MKNAEVKVSYALEGITCAGCARKLEQKINNLPGVTQANLNFSTAKLTVYGNFEIEEIEKLAIEAKVKLHHVKTFQPKPVSIWKSVANTRLLIALFLLIAGVSTSNIGDNLISILLLAGSIVIGGCNLFAKGIKNLFKLDFDMNTLMSIAVLGAAAIGDWMEGATVVMLFAVSEALEIYSTNKARNSINSLMEIAPNQAIILKDNKQIVTPVEDIQIDDIMIVKPGQKIAMDGVVIGGKSSANQSTITGESIPVTKNLGDQVFAGTLNLDGLLEVRVTKLTSDTTMAKIIHLVEEAQSAKAPSEKFIDKFAKYYTPSILVFSFLLMLLPPMFLGGSWEEWIYRGLSLLVVGCPCALVISTPIAIVTALGTAARQGVLIKGGLYLEELNNLKAIAFDKTGTLTKGRPAVNTVLTLKGEERELLGTAAALESNSTHPLAQSVITYASKQKVEYDDRKIEEFYAVDGKGIKAKVDDVAYYLGSPNFIKEQIDSLPETQITKLQSQGNTVIVLSNTTEALLIIAISDEIRDSSVEAIRELHGLGITDTIMLTGDNKATAQAIGDKVAIDKILAELLPEEKLAVIKEYQQHGKKITMVGDGVNDAPALALANVGIAMGGASSDTVLETADVTLMSNDLKKLPFAIKLSNSAMRIIKENITIALGIKLLALILIVPNMLTLWMALFADMGSTLIVTLNSLKLIKKKL